MALPRVLVAQHPQLPLSVPPQFMDTQQPPTALKAAVAKFNESVGGKLEFWYFDYGESTAYSVVTFPDEVAAATVQATSNAAGFASPAAAARRYQEIVG